MAEVLESLEARQLIDELASQLIAVCDAAVARVWLVGPGDECATCVMRPECPSQIRCLHLSASAGLTTRIDGEFRRFPLGAREMGQTAISGVPFVAASGLATAGLAEEAWLARHGVKSFAAVPLRSGARILGVLAVFSRRDLTDEEVRLLDLAASQAARAIEAIARARAAAHSRPPASGRPASAAAATSAPASPAPAVPALAATTRGKRKHEPREGGEALTLDEAQRRAIRQALAASEGRVSGARGAAVRLGIHPNTLTSRMIRLGMRRRARRS